MAEMYRLRIDTAFDPLKSSWGVWSHVPNGLPVYLPAGWEDELDARGIEYVTEQIENEDDGTDT